MTITTTEKKFTDAQRAAIDSDAKRILCVAGPGSGKTTVLVERIRRLVRGGVHPGKIVAITFTNEGARNLEDRLCKVILDRGPLSIKEDESGIHGKQFIKTNVEKMNLGFCGTLHSFALRMLKKHGAGMGYGDRVAIVGPDAAQDLLASKAQQLGCKMSLDDLLLLKQEGRPTGRLDVPHTCVAAYYDDLSAAGLVDLDSLLPEFLRLINEEAVAGTPLDLGFDHILWDEMQDSAEIDWRICHALPIANKFLVGDSDQAIYSFRGGRVDMMINEAVAPGVEVIRLEENFRSFYAICRVANNLIGYNEDRIKKFTISARGEGGSVELLRPAMNEGEEIARVASKIKELLDAGADANEIAILARTNALCAAYMKTLAACEIPVRKKSEAKQPKDWPVARALVELMVNPHNDTLAYFAIAMDYARAGMTPQQARKAAHSDRRAAEFAGVSLNDFKLLIPSNMMPYQGVIYLEKKRITSESCMMVSEKVRDLPADATMLDLALAMNGRTEEREEEGTGVTVTTIHNAKGREWDAVFLIGMEEEITPGRRKDANVPEERRLAYVGVTRARERLYVAHALSRVQNYGRKEIEAHTASRFIKEMGL